MCDRGNGRGCQEEESAHILAAILFCEISDMRLLSALVLFLSFGTNALAQIEISWKPARILTSSQPVESLDDRSLLVADDAKLVEQKVAAIKIVTASKFVKVSARKSLFEFADLIKRSETEWFLAGSGKYLIEVTTFDPEKGIEEKRIELVIGVSPDPIPDPKPDPVPPPKPDVSNVYNVGQISYQNAPRNPVEANAMSGWYRVGASKLFGANNSLSDIESILKEIDRQFAAKTPKDPGWEKWRTVVAEAVKAEQIKRKTFSRQDWYSCLIEIAASLEAVK